MHKLLFYMDFEMGVKKAYIINNILAFKYIVNT